MLLVTDGLLLSGMLVCLGLEGLTMSRLVEPGTSSSVRPVILPEGWREVWPTFSFEATGGITFTTGLLPSMGADVTFTEGLTLPLAGATFISSVSQ